MVKVSRDFHRMKVTILGYHLSATLTNVNPNKIMGSVETFKSLEDFNACLQQHEEDTNTKFIVLKSDRAFGKNGTFRYHEVLDVLIE